MSQILFCHSSIWYARINTVVLGFPKMELKRVNEEKASSTLRTTFHSNLYFLFTSNITTLNREESTAQCINTWRMSRNVVKKLIWTKHRRSKRQGESNLFRFFSLSLFNFFPFRCLFIHYWFPRQILILFGVPSKLYFARYHHTVY